MKQTSVKIFYLRTSHIADRELKFHIKEHFDPSLTEFRPNAKNPSEVMTGIRGDDMSYYALNGTNPVMVYLSSFKQWILE